LQITHSLRCELFHRCLKAALGKEHKKIKLPGYSVNDFSNGAMSTLTGHTSSVAAAVVTPDGQRAVSASDDQTLEVRDLWKPHLWVLKRQSQ
jgi:hypothetical protein